MTKGLIFTQFKVHGVPGSPVPAAPFSHVPSMEGADARLLYQSVENPAEFARLEMFNDYGRLGQMQLDCSVREHEVARYRCVEVSDTGPVDREHAILMLVAFCVPDELFCEVEEWYEHEHAMLLMKAEGWLRVRRYHVPAYGGRRWNHLAFHEMTDVKVLDSAERKFARSTPWRARYDVQSWFQAAGRWVYRKLDR